MPGNILQYRLIQRYAQRHNMDEQAAAIYWIKRNAVKFRAFFNRHAK